MDPTKSMARELAKAFWQSPAGSAARAQGYGICDYCNGNVPKGEGFLTGPITDASDQAGVYAMFGLEVQPTTGDVTPSMACESCFDAKELSPWDGNCSALPPKHAAAFEPVAQRARQLRGAASSSPLAAPPPTGAKIAPAQASPKISFRCPSCSKLLKVALTSEGKKVECPFCKFRTVVPPRETEAQPTVKPAKSKPEPAKKVAAAAKLAAGGGRERQARDALAFDKPDESRLANDQTYRITKVSQLTEICSLAVECAQKASRHKVAEEVKRIQVGTTLIMVAWGNVRPAVESQPLALLKLVLMLSLGWDMPVAVVRWYALSELGDFASEEKMLDTLRTTADQVDQLLAQLGLKTGGTSPADPAKRKRWWQFWK